MGNLPSRFRAHLAPGQRSCNATGPGQRERRWYAQVPLSDAPRRLRGSGTDSRRDRITLCLSTQVGCRRSCTFCQTARQGFQGNLTAGEIVNQFHSVPERDGITNIVYMGMGEPLDNPGETAASPRALCRTRRVRPAAATDHPLNGRNPPAAAGVPREPRDRRRQSRGESAQPFPEERRRIMPVENANPIEETLRLIRSRRGR
jgi:23S rRNA (adenine2503-C2)-methyltransferase